MRRPRRSASTACTIAGTSAGEGPPRRRRRDQPDPRGHRAGQRLGSRGDAGGRAGAGRAGGRQRGRRGLRAPYAQEDGGVRGDGGGGRPGRAHRRRGRCRRAARRARGVERPAGDRRADRGHAARRDGRAALDGADAEGRAGGNGGYRDLGSGQRRDPRRPDPLGRRRGVAKAPGRVSREARRRGRGPRAPGRRQAQVARLRVGGGVTEVVRVDPVAPDERVLADAARIWRAGGLVAFPTETFYGLGAAALDPRAARRVFQVKGRPMSMPLLVLVDSREMVTRVAAAIPERARALMDRHWPGALTLVLHAAPGVPAAVTAGTATVGVRLPAHGVARALAAALGAPGTAPSANPTGAAPPTTAAAVLARFGDTLDLVLDGGPTPGGAPSTVVDVTVDPPRVIRQGAVTVSL